MSEGRKANPYDYKDRDGGLVLTWQDFDALTRKVVEGIAARRTEVIVGVARAGLLPATAAATALDCDLIPVRVTRRVNRQVVHETPQWKVDVSDEVAGHVVAVIDEMASTGESIAVVAARCLEKGATRVITASLCAHTWANPMPDVVGLVSDAMVVFPWDRYNYLRDEWVDNPEIVEAFAGLGVELR